MSQRYSNRSSQILRRPSASVHSSYQDHRSNFSQNRYGKRPQDDLWDDQVEPPQKRARLDGDHHSVRGKSQQPSNPVANTPDQDREQEFLLVDGPGHVVFIDERGKRCPAICFNDLFLDTFKQIMTYNLELKERDGALQKAQLDLEQIRSTNQSSTIEKAKRMVEEAIKDQDDIEAEDSKLIEARRRYEALTSEKNWSRLKLENSKDLVLGILREILTREKFLEIPSSRPQEPAKDIEDHSSKPSPAPEKTANYQYDDQRFNRPGSSLASTRLHSPNEIEERPTPRELAYGRFMQAERELDFYQREFDYMQEVYAQEMAATRRFRQEQYPGRPETTAQTELDLQDLQEKRLATRNLIEAEEVYDRAEQHATALGLGDALAGIDNFYWPQQVIPEPSSTFPVDQPRIDSWLASIPDSAVVDPQRQEAAPESAEVDDWEAKSIEMFDSVSVVDRDLYRKKIDEWREISGRFRQAKAEGPVRGTVGRNPRRLCRDRQSASGSPRARS